MASLAPLEKQSWDSSPGDQNSPAMSCVAWSWKSGWGDEEVRKDKYPDTDKLGSGGPSSAGAAPITQ